MNAKVPRVYRGFTLRIASAMVFGVLGAPLALCAQSSPPPLGVTYAKDIAAILQRSCQNCHRPDSVAPMSLLTYEDAKAWAPAIKLRTSLRGRRGAMPPWFIEKDIGIQEYKADPSLSEEEIAKIAIWADSGAPRGNPAEMPPPRQFESADQWTIGQPDLVLTSPEVTVAAAEADKWTELGTVSTGLMEDRYVAAVEVREFNDLPRSGGSHTHTVGGRFVFHHVSYMSVDPASDAGTEIWPIHEVGRNADIFAPDAGKRLAAGSELYLGQAHLHSNGRDTRAHLKFAFKFHPKGYQPTTKPISLGLGNGVDIDVKPLTANQEVHAYTVLQQHTKIVSFEPHLHAAGTRMCLEAIWGYMIQTLTCAGYDHNWVRSYVYADDAAPLLPAGTILHLTGFLDTTKANPNVADPRNWSGSGRRSVANMFIDLGTSLVLTDQQFEQEMAKRRKNLRLRKNDYVIGCPLCQAVFP
jgi:mono/diheme cytochrome c family protein